MRLILGLGDNFFYQLINHLLVKDPIYFPGKLLVTAIVSRTGVSQPEAQTELLDPGFTPWLAPGRMAHTLQKGKGTTERHVMLLC